MFKKIVSVLIILSVLATVLCACGDDEDVSLVMPIGSDPLCIDPQAVETDEGKIIVANCYEGLVRLDENYKIVPGVAESWEISSDGLTYTFHLRKDTKWQLLNSHKDFMHDEKYLETFRNQVIAEDFQFGLRRAVNPATRCDEAEKLLCIKNAKAINDGKLNVKELGVAVRDSQTLVITLDRANPDFLRLLTLPAAMPCHEEFFNLIHAKYGLSIEYTFCNGPYYVSRWAEDNSIVLMKNENYKGNNKVTAGAVYLSVNTDEDTYADRFKQSTYDLLYTDNDIMEGLEELDNVNYIEAQNKVSGLCFNCADPVLTNVKIRQALTMITKFDEIAQPASASAKASGIVPPCCRFGEKSYREAAGSVNNPAYNEKNAVALLKKGLKEVGIDSLEVKIICTDEYTAQMQKMIQNWQKVLSTSVVAKVSTLEDSEFRTALRNGTYQIAAGSISTDSSTVIDALKIFTKDSSSNIFNYQSDKYDKLVNEIMLKSSGNKILSDCKAAEQMLINDGVFCPLYAHGEFIALNNEVTGVFPTPAFEGIIFLNGGRK